MLRTPVFLAIIVVLAVPAHAQLPKPLPFAVVDVRFYGGLGQDPTTVSGPRRSVPTPVTAANLPNRAPGGVAAYICTCFARRILHSASAPKAC
jgi:hypothetical protein